MKNFARKNVDPFTMKILTKKIRKIQFQQKRQLGKLQFTARIVQKKVARRTLRNFLENDFWTPPLPINFVQGCHWSCGRALGPLESPGPSARS